MSRHVAEVIFAEPRAPNGKEYNNDAAADQKFSKKKIEEDSGALCNLASLKSPKEEKPNERKKAQQQQRKREKEIRVGPRRRVKRRHLRFETIHRHQSTLRARLSRVSFLFCHQGSLSVV